MPIKQWDPFFVSFCRQNSKTKWIPPKLVGSPSSVPPFELLHSFCQMSICAPTHPTIFLSKAYPGIHACVDIFPDVSHQSSAAWKWCILFQDSLKLSVCTSLAAISAMLTSQSMFVTCKNASLLTHLCNLSELQRHSKNILFYLLWVSSFYLLCYNCYSSTFNQPPN